MPVQLKTKTDKVFRISLFLKAVDGALEIIGGVTLLFITPAKIASWAAFLTQHELSQDPNDFIAKHILHSAQHLTTAASWLAAIYLLSHGVTKIILVVEILRDHLWAFKGMMIFLVLSIIYQTYRIIYTPSWSLLLLTIFDGFILYLTTKEERKLRIGKGSNT